MNKSSVKRVQFKELIKKIRREILPNTIPVTICREYLSGKRPLPEFLKSVDNAEKYYWIVNVYTSLIPASIKKSLAAHFTPSNLSEYVINRVEKFGFNITNSRILDPASGGAAFLVPFSAAIIKKMKSQGLSDNKIGSHIQAHISGIEIEKNLATLSGIILKNLFSVELPRFSSDLSKLILHSDSLKVSGRDSIYDAIISNPPYGRLLNPPKYILNKFANILSEKHINKYALFVKLSIDWVKPGGFIALILPTSFIAGPYFANLRKYILEKANVLAIDMIDKRKDLFVNVLQDTCILFMRKKNNHTLVHHPTCRFLGEDGSYKELGKIDIPTIPSTRSWIIPCELSPDLSTNDFFSKSYAKLKNYGYSVRAGYLVWNRQVNKCREGKRPRKNEYPLVWAHCVKTNEPCSLSTHRIHGRSNNKTFVTFENSSNSLIKQPAIILQRTTNRHQAKRIIAGYIPQSMIDEYGAVISENHTIVIYPTQKVKQQVSLKMLCKLLNSKSVDNRYRQTSGTVSISVKLLREIPFPPINLVKQTLNKNISTEGFDAFVEDCYKKALRLK